jgi:ABC-type uncharacterized transport system substrate-binding protein
MLGLFLIHAAALVLLLGDLDARRARPAPLERPTRIALAYFAPEVTVEECMQGLLKELEREGWTEGRNLEVRRVHAQGEIAGIATMLQALDSESYDAIVTFSTPVLAAATSMVRRNKVVLTYCFDPVAAGAGRSLEDHLPFLTGIGSFPPLEKLLSTAQGITPPRKRMGVVYNASEANSSRRVEAARKALQSGSLALDAVSIASSSEVAMAAQALIARGADCIWAVGDNTAVQAIDALIRVANDARIPVIADDPTHVDKGAVAGIGVAFHEVGRRTAPVLARVMRGEDPARIPIRQLEVLDVACNPARAQALGIQLPEAVLRAANRGPYVRSAAQVHHRIIDLVIHNESETVEQCVQGVRNGLREAGWIEGVDCTLRVRSAQGDISTLSTIMDAVASGDGELVIPLATPALQAALRRITNKPIVYALVASGVTAGAAKSATDHVHNVIGSDVPAPIEEGVELLLRLRPDTRSIGTLFVPGEVNSVLYKEQLERVASARKLAVIAIGVTSVSEVSDAALALCSRKPDAICQILDSASASGFALIAAAADREAIPVVGFAPDTIRKGAMLTIARDFERNGARAAQLAVEVLSGANPAQMPLSVDQATWLALNPAVASRHGIEFPEELRRLAQLIVGQEQNR